MCRTRSGAIHQSSAWGAAARMGAEVVMVPWVLDPRIQRPLWSTESKRRACMCTRCKRLHTPSRSPAPQPGCNHAPCRSRCSRAHRTYTGCTKAGSRRGLTGPRRVPCASSRAAGGMSPTRARAPARCTQLLQPYSYCVRVVWQSISAHDTRPLFTRDLRTSARLCSSQPPASLIRSCVIQVRGGFARRMALHATRL